MLHSFVGLAAVLVGFATYLASGGRGGPTRVHLVEIYVGVLIGAVTFTGSIVAFGKLSARIIGKPLLLPGRHWLNLAAARRRRARPALLRSWRAHCDACRRCSS